MLSFMREQGPGNPSEHPSAGVGPQDGSSSGAAGGQEFLTVSANSKNLRRSTIVVAVLVAVGLAGLGYMIRKSQPQAASARQAQSDEAQIEAALGRLRGDKTEAIGHMDEITKKFYVLSDVFQVKVNELAKNPFEVQGYLKSLKGEIPLGLDAGAQTELMRRQRLQQKAGTLKLLCITQSEQGDSCMVNDQILRRGDKIEGCTVTQIGKNFVELAWTTPEASGAGGSETEEQTIVLKLSQ
jgi:preprotein translocase subunit SecG